MASTNKLIDYTQRGKPFEQRHEARTTATCGSASLTSCLSEPSRRRCRSQDEESSMDGNTSGTTTLEATLALLLNTVEPQRQKSDDSTRIDFMLKIPSRRGRKQRSDLRERFSKSRPINCEKHNSSHIIKTLLGGDAHLSKRRARKHQQRASF